jgi:hypothetical protein
MNSSINGTNKNFATIRHRCIVMGIQEQHDRQSHPPSCRSCYWYVVVPPISAAPPHLITVWSCSVGSFPEFCKKEFPQRDSNLTPAKKEY